MKALRFGLIVLCVLGFTLPSLKSFANPEEGMWDFTNLPSDVLKEKYQFEPSPEWLEHLKLSSVKFPGGSGSFVSSTGLVLTNHHVASDTLQKASTPENDLLKNGFYAKTQAEEIKTADLYLMQLREISDVTTDVLSVVTPDMDAGQALAAKNAKINEIKNAAEKTTGLDCSVVTLYNGKAFHLYKYKKFTDIRIVFAPEKDIAFFGGDPDNFEYPRYDLDMTLLRVYENNKPIDSPNYLKWSANGAEDGELIFVSGHPGSTNRSLTSSALKNLEYVLNPFRLARYYRLEVMLKQFSDKSEENRRRAEKDYFSIQNSRKGYDGRQQGLHDPFAIQAKKDAELKTLVKLQERGDTGQVAQYAQAIHEIDKAEKQRAKLYVRYVMLEGEQGFSSQLFSKARFLVRAAAELAKQEKDRLPGYSGKALENSKTVLLSSAPIYEDLETAFLKNSLSFLMEKLGEDTLVTAIMNGKSPEARAREIISGTRLFDINVREQLFNGGQQAIDQSADPMIALAKLVDPEARAIRKQYEDLVQGPLERAYPVIANTNFLLNGKSVYPDATSTLRLSYGIVKGYQEGDANIVPFTTLQGAFDHEKFHGQKDPWVLPQSWHQAFDAKKINLDTRLNFVCTADIIGGNSGSPVVNKNGELVGLIFDGNIHSLPGDYYYNETLNRAVAVHSSAMMEALRNVYGAGALAEELGK